MDDYSGSTFFDKWNFYHEDDPTNGLVAYQGRTAAFAADLAYVNTDGTAVIAVDSTNNYTLGTNRPSVRLQSKNSYAHALVLWDISHMPVGCSVWPALWSNGEDWPNGGEIDVLEGVGDTYLNTMSLHTSDGCTAQSSSSNASFSGTLDRTDCYAYASGTGGCDIQSGSKSTPDYGSGLNALGGAIYAQRFDETGVRIWILRRGEIPEDVTAGAPNPDSGNWPEPKAYFPSSTCASDTFFGNQTLITDITLCGDWAGSDSVYGVSYTGNGEASCGGTCAATVMTGSNFEDAYFTFNSVKVYQQL